MCEIHLTDVYTFLDKSFKTFSREINRELFFIFYKNVSFFYGCN